MVRRIAYVSAAATLPVEADLLSLLEQSRLRNGADGVTGLLLYHDGAYMQVIEGDRAVAGATYERIRADERHHRIRTLFDETATEREFPEWSMGFVPLTTALLRENAGVSDFLARRGGLTQTEAASRTHRLLAQFRAS